jgi:hypothetical protein
VELITSFWSVITPKKACMKVTNWACMKVTNPTLIFHTKLQEIYILCYVHPKTHEFKSRKNTHNVNQDWACENLTLEINLYSPCTKWKDKECGVTRLSLQKISKLCE